MKKGQKLEVIAPTSVVVKNFFLEDILSKDFVKLIKEKFSKDYDVKFVHMQIALPLKGRKERIESDIESAKKKMDESEEKEIVIKISTSADRIKFTHRDDTDIEEKKILIEASDENILKKLIEG